MQDDDFKFGLNANGIVILSKFPISVAQGALNTSTNSVSKPANPAAEQSQRELESLLFQSVGECNVEGVLKALEMGAPLNHVDSSRLTPLMIATGLSGWYELQPKPPEVREGFLKIMHLLLEKGAAPKDSIWYGFGLGG